MALGVWELLSRAGRLPRLFFPAPSSVGVTLYRMAVEGRLLPNVAATLRRVALGMAFGGLPGLLLGLLMGWSRRLRTVLDPIVAALHPLPKIIMLPLFMIMVGIGEPSRIIVVALAAFFPMMLSAAAGVRQIPPLYFEVAHNYGAGPRNVLTRVVIPGSLPLILSGLRLAANSALLLAISVELSSSATGLGSMAWFAWQTLRTTELYVSLLATAVLGVTFNAGLQRLSSWLLPWQEQYRPDL